MEMQLKLKHFCPPSDSPKMFIGPTGIFGRLILALLDSSNSCCESEARLECYCSQTPAIQSAEL